jgi:hypothetical protein
MSRAVAASIGGIGVNLASTFAPSLGLSVHQQHIGFVVGTAMMITALILFARLWIRRAHSPSPQQPAPSTQPTVGIDFSSEGGSHVIEGGSIHGFDIGIRMQAPGSRTHMKELDIAGPRDVPPTSAHRASKWREFCKKF